MIILAAALCVSVCVCVRKKNKKLFFLFIRIVAHTL